MTGRVYNVSNVKMHSSQRNGHPTKRKKLTDQTAHSCPSQTDGSKKTKGPPTDSVRYCSDLSTSALPTHSDRQKAQIKNKHGGSNISEERGEAEGGMEVTGSLKQGGEGEGVGRG